MPSRLEQIRALERRYSGPIPPAARDAVLYGVPQRVRTARCRIRTHRLWALQAIVANARWRAIEDDNPDFQSLERLHHRVSRMCAMMQAVSRLLTWHLYLASLPQGRDSDN